MKSNQVTNLKSKWIPKMVWLILLFFIAACAGPQETDQTGAIVQTATVTPSPEPTVRPFVAFTLSPSPSPTLHIPTPTQAPLERITFTMYKAMITFVNSDGTGLESPRLFEPFYIMDDDTGRMLAWSPDGRFLAFDGADTYLCDFKVEFSYCPTNYGIFVADYAQNVIIQHVEGTLTNASWAPDSQRLVLSVGEKADGRRYFGNLFILDVKSGEIKPLTLDPASDLYPAWSPDGQWIAFIRFDPGPDCSLFPLGYQWPEQCHHGSLYRIRPDGRDLQLLFEPIFFDNQGGSIHDDNGPTWSPDSQWLAFLTSNKIERLIPDISILNVATGESELVAGEREEERNPAWSPDGERLAFVAKGTSYNFDVYLWDMQKKSRINLTQTSTRESDPVWSWSGAHIAYFSDWDLWVMNADGTNKVLITDKAICVKPAWQPGVQP